MLTLFENKKFLLLLVLINFLAGFYSINYYFSQLSQTNPFLWLFVIDCPLYAIIFGIVLLLKIKEKKIEWLFFISIVGNIKYGLWTIFVLFQANMLFSYPLLLLGHILLVLEVIVLYKKYIFRLKHLILGLIWFILNDFFDYVLLTHPVFSGNFAFVAFFAIISTIFISFFVSIFFIRQSI
ncbi:MAG: DUF1405 domain-containing protein [archaeon]|jgi:uncharacterized membrane protein YpjA